ncbi:hypothetical protein HMPREF0262_01994 [Clostridium sp. ATCC 29733]|nr:hypothetical protein HMPREF0262_01994 [Clostridium sp. ATCC 29733]
MFGFWGCSVPRRFLPVSIVGFCRFPCRWRILPPKHKKLTDSRREESVSLYDFDILF